MQTPVHIRRGAAQLRAVRAEYRRLFVAVGIFSLFVNLLMLTGPLFMLQVYDRVLGSRSEATLLALTLLMAFLFAMMGVLDFARGRVLSRIGAGFQARLDRRVFQAMVRGASVTPDDGPRNHLDDLESVRRFIGSPLVPALFDMPWTPLFLGLIFVFHPLLGWVALAGLAILSLVTAANQWLSRHAQTEAILSSTRAQRMSEQIRTEAEMVRSLGMQDAAFSRWQRIRAAALDQSVRATETTGGFSSLTRTLRMFLQSLMLGVGAWLVLQEQMTPGGMIAASIMLGRALAPIDLALGQWQVLQRARQGWIGLAELLGRVAEEPPRTTLPRPTAHLTVDQITVIPPGQPQASLRMISLEVAPGEAVGVIGPSGAGKSTLARALVGVWQPAGGRIRLGGAALDQYEPDVLGQHVGYLPQRVQLFDGTIAENIARLRPGADDAQIVAAARKAAAHEMILKLPQGYDTPVSSAAGRLSGGQIQRIGLARAMFGDPVLLVLDEPNSNLDNAGSQALNQAIAALKAAGGSIVIMAHRPAAIQLCDKLLMLENGMRRAFGPRDDVLRQVTQNHGQLIGQVGAGGVS
ncbi:type I secretion system permease/ATPase [Palleronia sp.]|uniref:type I secretion system permease/ATPase n=1 Tax=Palleronia sp. TaxID=1940284 RepID=UPI0035C84E5F